MKKQDKMQKEHNQAILSPSPSVGDGKKVKVLSFEQNKIYKTLFYGQNKFLSSKWH